MENGFRCSLYSEIMAVFEWYLKASVLCPKMLFGTRIAEDAVKKTVGCMCETQIALSFNWQTAKTRQTPKCWRSLVTTFRGELRNERGTSQVALADIERLRKFRLHFQPPTRVHSAKTETGLTTFDLETNRRRRRRRRRSIDRSHVEETVKSFFPCCVLFLSKSWSECFKTLLLRSLSALKSLSKYFFCSFLLGFEACQRLTGGWKRDKPLCHPTPDFLQSHENDAITVVINSKP